MKTIETALPGVVLLEPRVFRDERGAFTETFQLERYAEAGIPGPFVQDNFSRSLKGTLRGLHYQEPCAQGKLVQVLRGTVYDVAVDVRAGSPCFGRWVGVTLDDVDLRQLWVPPGFAHGFLVLSEVACFAYKCTAPYAPEHERGIRWDDPDLAIDWPAASPLLSPKDARAPRLADAKILPRYQAPPVVGAFGCSSFGT